MWRVATSAVVEAVSTGWKWFAAACGFALVVLAWEEWHAKRRLSAGLWVVLGVSWFLWAGFGWPYQVLLAITLTWFIVALAFLVKGELLLRVRLRSPVYLRPLVTQPDEEARLATVMAVHDELTRFYRATAKPAYERAQAVVDSVNKQFLAKTDRMERTVGLLADGWLSLTAKEAAERVEHKLEFWTEFAEEDDPPERREEKRRLIVGMSTPKELQDPFWNYFLNYRMMVAWVSRAASLLGHNLEHDSDFQRLKELHPELDRESRRIAASDIMSDFKLSLNWIEKTKL